MAGPRDVLGRQGEALAERHLRRAGMSVLARRFVAPGVRGEIDLVMRSGDLIVFVEVKSQTGDRLVDPEERVGRDKQRCMARVARAFLQARRCPDAPCRFDVVAVVFSPEAEAGSPRGATKPPEIRHVVDAFTPETTEW